ncbi:MAG: helix-turn-helix transcriptional regulator [Clostridia bacterium]|nr:helix-turn-helix transcriptional regulator [Clostridia bacterium]
MSDIFYCINLSVFAERLSELLFETNLNPPKLSKIIGCGRATINRYTLGNKMPTVDMLVKIADYFQCTTDYLLGLEDENYSQTFNACPPFKIRLPQLLNHYGITRYKLQKESGISESTFYYWANGITTPTLEKLVKIAQVLKCTLDFVIGRTKS